MWDQDGDVIPDFAVDRTGLPDTNGNLYAVWQDARFSGGQHDDIAFSRSTDGGQTWSAPEKVNKTTNDAAAFTAAVHVRDDGTVAVSYYDFRNDVNGDPTLTPTTGSCTRTTAGRRGTRARAS